MSKKIDEEFKKMVVELHESGKSVKELKVEYGIGESAIYRWIQLYKPNKATGMSEAEIRSMKKEMVKLQEEVAILKKALTIFAVK